MAARSCPLPGPIDPTAVRRPCDRDCAAHADRTQFWFWCLHAVAKMTPEERDSNRVGHMPLTDDIIEVATRG